MLLRGKVLGDSSFTLTVQEDNSGKTGAPGSLSEEDWFAKSAQGYFSVNVM